MPRALVTGGTGMIGSALARKLCEDGWTTHVLTRHESAIDRLIPLRDRLTVHRIDWAKPDELTTAIAQANPDAVMHLAGPPFNPPGLPRSLFIEAAVENTSRLLDALERAQNPARIVYASSVAVYAPSAAPVSEAHPIEPATWLGTSKAMAGTLLAGAARITGREVAELRICMPYGPNDRPERLIPSLIAAARARREIPLTSGEQERDFIYVDDVIAALVAATRVEIDGPAVFNIGSGRPVRVRELALMVLELMGAAGLARFGALPTRTDEIMFMGADVSLARRVLKWEPKTTLEEGIRNTIDWYERNSLHRV